VTLQAWAQRVLLAEGQDRINALRRMLGSVNCDRARVAEALCLPVPELDAWLARLGIGARVPVTDQCSLRKRRTQRTLEQRGHTVKPS
jgi:hypothetical protein